MPIVRPKLIFSMQEDQPSSSQMHHELPKAPPVNTEKMHSSHHYGPGLPGAFELFRPSTKALKLNLWTFIWGSILPVLILVLPVLIALTRMYSNVNNVLESNSSASSVDSTTAALNVVLVVFGLLSILLIFILVPFMYVLKLQSAKGVKVGLHKALKQCLPFVWRIIGLSIFRSVIIIVGLILLIVPGVLLWRRYFLAPYYLVDQNLSIFEAMKKSAAQTKPYSSALWGMLGVYILITIGSAILGIIPFIGSIIGAIIGLLYTCAGAVRYLQIKSAS